MKIQLALLTLTLSLGVLQANATANESKKEGANKRPNIVLIMTDDQGYGDLSITGNEWIKTPNMDQIAKEGAWLKKFYVSPVCTPTRAHLMTGRYGFRTRAIDTYLGRACMEPAEITVAEALKEAGYATGIFGKWHLGDYYPTRAIDQGFETAVVHQGGGLRQPSNPPAGERYDDPILFRNGSPKRYEGYCTDIFFDEAIDFIKAKADAKQPFFTYIATNAPHGPFDEPPTREMMEYFSAKFPDDKNSRRGGFYSMIKNVDDNIGRLMGQLKSLNIDKDTLVIFLTDNGPSAGSAGPFRGKKGSVFEGGIRTVCFMRWPDQILPETTAEVTTAHIDLMPTILDICNVEKPAEVSFDGRSLKTLVMPDSDSNASFEWPDRHLFFQWHRGDVPQRFNHFAVVDPQGQWKLLHRGNSGKAALESPPEFQLFDLQNDVSEDTNVASKYPEKVESLKQKYSEWFDDVCTTREPNFGMPPIVIGSPNQPTVILTPQDKRADAGGAGWYSKGHWPVDVQAAGPYTVEVRLTVDAKSETIVTFVTEVGGKQQENEIVFPRGVRSAAIGKVTLPSLGAGKVRARLEGQSVKDVHVHQITIK